MELTAAHGCTKANPGEITSVSKKAAPCKAGPQVDEVASGHPNQPNQNRTWGVEGVSTYESI